MVRYPAIADVYKNQLAESHKGSSWFSFAPNGFLMYSFSGSETATEAPSPPPSDCRVVDVC